MDGRPRPPVSASPEPEVAPVSTLVLSPLLQDPKFLVSVLVVLAAVAFWYMLKSNGGSHKAARGKGVPNVVLVGPPRAGKTSVFAKLALDEITPTIPSLHSSITTFKLPSNDRIIRLIDVPGHPRLKGEAKSRLRTADGAIFLVDTGVASRQEGAARIAEEIPPVLTALAAQSLRSSSSPRLLMLVHKSDSVPIKNRSVILARTLQALTQEMDRLKSSRSTIGGKIESISAVSSRNKGGVFATLLRLFGLGGTSGPAGGAEVDEVAEEDAESLIWGEKGGFKWEDVEGVEIEWAVSGWLLPGNERKPDQSDDDTSEDGLKEVRNWLEEM